MITNTFDSIVAEIRQELVRATTKFPTWPTDPLHAKAIIDEEAGEIAKAILEHLYEPHKGVTRADIHAEVVQTACMAIRWLLSEHLYVFERSHQHNQTPLSPGVLTDDN